MTDIMVNRFSAHVEQRRYPVALDKAIGEDDTVSTVSTMASPTGDFGGLAHEDLTPALSESAVVVSFPQKPRDTSPESCSTASPRDDFVSDEADSEVLSEPKTTKAAGAATLLAISPRVVGSDAPHRTSKPMLPLACLRSAGGLGAVTSAKGKSPTAGATHESEMSQLDSGSTTASTPAAKTSSERSKPVLLLPTACLIRNTQEAAARPFLPVPRRTIFGDDDTDCVSPSTRGKHDNLRNFSMNAFDSNSSSASECTSKRSRPSLTRRVSFADDERLQEIIHISGLAAESSP